MTTNTHKSDYGRRSIGVVLPKWFVSNLLLGDVLTKYVEVTDIESIELRSLHIKPLKLKPNIQRRRVLNSIKIYHKF